MKNFDDFEDQDPFEDDLDTLFDEGLRLPSPEEAKQTMQKYKTNYLDKDNLQFRPLRADEIDVRMMGFRQVGQKWEARLYLYQKARVPAQILDETVGPLNWQVSYGDDIKRCTISIYNPRTGAWISKENVGSPSDLESEAVKSEASDAFKRAASYWGIGRELYSAGDIITDKIRVIDNNKPGYSGKNFIKCYDKFEVASIEYDDNRQIKHLVIRNVSQNCICYKI